MVTNFTKLGFIRNWRWQYCLSHVQMTKKMRKLQSEWFFFSPPLAIPIRSTTWWFCLQTGPMWKMPAECKSTRTSSRRRSRSFMTSTPLAQRSVSTPTRKGQAWNLALPLWPLSPSLYSLAVCLSAIPSQGRWIAPRAPATSDVTGASYDNVVWRGLHTNLFSHKQQFK